MLIIIITNLNSKLIKISRSGLNFHRRKIDLITLSHTKNLGVNSKHLICIRHASIFPLFKLHLLLQQFTTYRLIIGLRIFQISRGTEVFNLSQRKRVTRKLGSLIGQTATGGRVSHRGSNSRITGKRLNRGGTTGKELRSINTSLFKTTDNSLRRIFLIPLLLIVLALILDQLLLLLIRFQSKLLLNPHHLLIKLHLILFALKTGTTKKGTNKTLRGTSHRSRTSRLASICQPFNKSTHIFKELEESERCSSASMHTLTRRTCIRFLELTTQFL